MTDTSDNCQTYTDAVFAELDKLGRSPLELRISPDRINFILHDVYRDGAPPFVAAMSLLEAE